MSQMQKMIGTKSDKITFIKCMGNIRNVAAIIKASKHKNELLSKSYT